VPNLADGALDGDGLADKVLLEVGDAEFAESGRDLARDGNRKIVSSFGGDQVGDVVPGVIGVLIVGVGRTAATSNWTRKRVELSHRSFLSTCSSIVGPIAFREASPGEASAMESRGVTSVRLMNIFDVWGRRFLEEAIAA
jgi:hypothetical protein